MRQAFRWLPMLLAGALLVGGCQQEDERVADIIQRFLLASRGETPTRVERFVGELPDGLPIEPPTYPDADILTSTRLTPGPGAVDQATGEPLQGAVFFILLDASDDREDVYRFYERELDEDPWQLEQSASSQEVDRLDFSDVEDTDITGSVTLVQGEEDEATSILVFLQDAGASAAEQGEFQEGGTAFLPDAFPPEVPVFDDAMVIGTGYAQEPGRQSFLLQFITLESEDEVIDFYRERFEDEGWTTEEGQSDAGGLLLRFRDEGGDIEGDVSTEEFVEDAQYILVRIQLQANPSREEGEEEEPTPEDTEEATEEPTAERDASPTPVRTVPKDIPPTG